MSTVVSTFQRKRKSEISHTKDSLKRKRVSKPLLVYKPGMNIFSDYKVNSEIRVYIDSHYLLSPHNTKRIWGTDVYSDESDLIGVCQHMGWINTDELIRSGQGLRGIIATVKIVEPVDKDRPEHSIYTASYRNKLRSRALLRSTEVKNAYTVVKCLVIRNTVHGEFVSDEFMYTKLSREQLEHQRFLPDVTLVYNLSNEPVFKYSLKAVSDEGFDPTQFASYKLLSKVLYLETRCDRYELSVNEKNKKYRFAQVNLNRSKKENEAEVLPLEEEKITIVHDDLEWKDISWGDDSVLIKGEKYKFTNAQWIDRTTPIEVPVHG